MSIGMLLTTLDIEKFLAGPEVSSTFVIRLWQGQGLLGGTMQGICLDVGETPHVAFTGAGTPHVAFTGAGVAGVAAAEAEHRTTTRE